MEMKTLVKWELAAILEKASEETAGAQIGILITANKEFAAWVVNTGTGFDVDAVGDNPIDALDKAVRLYIERTNQ
jgi:hypothetical protein